MAKQGLQTPLHNTVGHYKEALDMNAWWQYGMLVERLSLDETLLQGHKVHEYNEGKQKLKNHNTTLQLFNIALNDHYQWPTSDSVIKQHIYSKTPSAEKVIKNNAISGRN